MTDFSSPKTQKLAQLNNQAQDILHCLVKDDTGLNDFQKLPNSVSIPIQKVGIERFRIPILLDNTHQGKHSHDANVCMFVNLNSQKTGVNMSRFCQILQEELFDQPLNFSLMKKIIERFTKDLRDFPDEPFISVATLQIDFSLACRQKSLSSDNWGWQYYPISMEVISNHNLIEYWFSINYEYSSTCPCSLSMAKQYEQEYRQGQTHIGQGMATAHSQRSLAQLKLKIKEEKALSLEFQQTQTWMDIVIESLRAAIPTETQSMVKRIDEQAFAILNGNHPIFVEHAIRSLALVFNDLSFISYWWAKVEHFESLHSHNAVAISDSLTSHIEGQ